MQNKAPKKNKTSETDLEDIKSISRLSYNSVSYYVELLLLDEAAQKKLNTAALIITADQMNEHPLVQWEKDTQSELFDFLKFATEDKRSCQLAKKMSLSEGLSSLGIEIN